MKKPTYTVGFFTLGELPVGGPPYHRPVDELVPQIVPLPGGELRIRQPAQWANLPDDRGVEWAPLAPYWSVMWRSGVALAEEVASADVRGLRVVELGCGLALPSMAAARGGAEVLSTDHEPEPLQLLEDNARANGLTVETMRLDWTDADDLVARGPFDLVLAADVLYDRENTEALLELIPRLAPRAWLTDPGRADPIDRLREIAGTVDVVTASDVVTLYALDMNGP